MPRTSRKLNSVWTWSILIKLVSIRYMQFKSGIKSSYIIIFLALCGMGATQSWVTELCHCLTQVCRKRRLEKGWTNGTSVTRSSSRCEGFVSGSHIFFIVNETLKQNLQSCESLNDLKCVDWTINPIQFNSFQETNWTLI